MTGRLDVERRLDLLLAPDHDRVPDRVIEAALEQIATTPQARRAPFAAWRPTMNTSRARYLAFAALLAAAAFLGVMVLGGGSAPTLPSAAPPSAPPSSGPTALASPIGFAPFGYTGGGTIEYTTHDSAGNDTLWLVDPSGANDRELVPGGCCGLFSPDGTLLAVAKAGVAPSGTTRDPGLIGIEVLDHPDASPAFTIPTACTACGMLALNNEPDAWSPDGRYVAVGMWNDAGESGIGIADRDFPLPWDWAKLKATGSHPDIPIAFSPDSSQLLFLRDEQPSGPTSTGPLFVLNIGTGEVRQLSRPGVTVSANGLIQGPASWSPDGNTIVFAGLDAATGRTSIFAMASSIHSSADSPRVLVADAPGATSARYSPDGSLIAFDRQTSGWLHDLFVVKPDGTGLTNLTAAFEPGVCCGQWSPDARALVVAGTTTDDFHNLLYIVSASGDGIWQVTTTPGVTTGFLWGPGFR
jgi:Tol biopolymer transport system component